MAFCLVEKLEKSRPKPKGVALLLSFDSVIVLREGTTTLLDLNPVSPTNV
jgi:hypothetical protein